MMELRKEEDRQQPHSPEQDKRTGPDHGWGFEGPLPDDVSAAYDYVESVVNTSDYIKPLVWHGWALREAFLAGVTWAEERHLQPATTDSNSPS